MPSLKLNSVLLIFTASVPCAGSPATLEINLDATRIEVEILSGPLSLTPAEVGVWVESAARVMSHYYGQFPVPHLRIRVVPVGGERINGKTWGGRVPFIRVLVGDTVRAETLATDWVLTHEMTHVAFPRMEDQHDWIEEGLATYVEAVARTRSGRMNEQEFWEWISEGLAIGARAAARGGLNHQNSWDSTYWGGALYFLLSDLAVREQTGGRFDLADALIGVVAAGGTIRERWSLAETLHVADDAVGVDALSELYRRMSLRPFVLSLNDLFANLGVVVNEAGVELDDQALQARVRQSITRVD